MLDLAPEVYQMGSTAVVSIIAILALAGKIGKKNGQPSESYKNELALLNQKMDNHITHICTDVGDIKTDIKDLRGDMKDMANDIVDIKIKIK